MKLLVVTFLIVALAFDVNARRGGRGRGRRPNFGGDLVNFDPERLDRLVQSIQNATVTTASNETKPVWDLIPRSVRFLLLNQTSVAALWNVSENLQANTTRLEWASLPQNVQTVLSEDLSTGRLVNQTFSNWNWIVSAEDEQYANATIFSLFPAESVDNLNLAQASLSQLSLSQLVNKTLLRENRPSRGNRPDRSGRSRSFSVEESEEEEGEVEIDDVVETRRGRPSRQQRPGRLPEIAGPQRVIGGAFLRAKKLLRSFRPPRN